MIIHNTKIYFYINILILYTRDILISKKINDILKYANDVEWSEQHIDWSTKPE